MLDHFLGVKKFREGLKVTFETLKILLFVGMFHFKNWIEPNVLTKIQNKNTVCNPSYFVMKSLFSVASAFCRSI